MPGRGNEAGMEEEEEEAQHEPMAKAAVEGHEGQDTSDLDLDEGRVGGNTAASLEHEEAHAEEPDAADSGEGNNGKAVVGLDLRGDEPGGGVIEERVRC